MDELDGVTADELNNYFKEMAAGAAPLNAQQIVKDEQSKWAKEWNVGGEYLRLEWGDCEEEAERVVAYALAIALRDVDA